MIDNKSNIGNTLKLYYDRQSDLLEEVGDGQCCWTEGGKIAHVVRNTHALKPPFLSLIPCPMAFFLC